MRVIINTFRKNLLIVFVLFIFALMPALVPAQNSAAKVTANKSWNAFWVKFSAAVSNKDRQAVIVLSAQNFYTPGGQTVEAWLDHPNDSWRRLQKSVDQGTKDHTSNRSLIWRITRDRNLIFGFINNRWQFYGVFTKP